MSQSLQTTKKCSHTLNFKVDFKKELWFIKEKYADAKKVIGKNQFLKIINFNIPGLYFRNYQQLIEKLYEHLKLKRQGILSRLLKQKSIYQKKWHKFEKDFFNQMEVVTGLKWQQSSYNLYFIYSCFWGGDYDEEGKNIYVNPFLKHGDPFYVIFHELSHIIFWEYIYANFSHNFIIKNHHRLWELSEVMVNYPLLKISLDFKFPVIIPLSIKGAEKIMSNFFHLSYTEIIQQEIKSKIKKAG